MWRSIPLEVPTVPNSLDELQTQISSIARKLDQVPFGEIGNNLRDTLKSANVLFKQLDAQVVPEMKDTLGAARKTFGEANQLLQKDSPVQSDLREALQQLTQTLQSLNALVGLSGASSRVADTREDQQAGHQGRTEMMQP